MLELELNKIEDREAGKERTTLTRKDFEHVVRLEKGEKQPCIVLHADWSRPPSYLKDILPSLWNSRFKIVVYCRPNDPMEYLLDGLMEGAQFCLSLEGSTKEASSLRDLKSVADIELFVPLAHPAQDLTELWTTLEALPQIKLVNLGIGWRHQLSGPGELQKADYPAWTDMVQGLAEELTARRITMSGSCGIPLCLFTTTQLGKLSALRVHWPLAHCRHNPLVTAEGRLASCYKLVGFASQPLADVESLGQAVQAWEKKLYPFKSLCRHSPDTTVCLSHKCDACGGACLADELLTWQSGRK